jgi:O-antigen/teichoic acid export membrane protein
VLHVVLVGLCAVLVYKFGDIALHIAYKSKFDEQVFELNFWVVAAFLLALTRPLEAWLLALRRARTMFYCKAGGATIALVSAFALIGSYGLAGVLAGMVVGLLLNCILLAICRFTYTQAPEAT